MYTISIVNQKGGVGKTATANALGYGLAKAGKRVLLVDMDAQQSLTITTVSAIRKHNIYDVLTGNAKPEQAIISVCGGLDIIPASERLAGIDRLVNSRTALQRALEPLQGNYDYCIIDCPIVANALVLLPLLASNGIVIPAQADALSYIALNQVISTVAEVRKNNHSLCVLGILLTMYNPRATINRNCKVLFEQMAREIGTRVFDVPIRRSVSIQEAQARKQSIFDYAGKSAVAEDYRRFTADVLSIVESED